jgi:curved DNA-binding protein CbpA
MLAAPADILGLGVLPHAEEIEKAWRRQARAYHPDPYGKFGERYRDLANRRMSEINNARDELKKQYPVKK